MKTMSKKIASIVLALCLCFSLVGTALAATSSDADSFTITVNGAANGESYSAYKIFDVTYDTDADAYSYTIDSSSAWYSTVAAATNVFTLTQVNGSTTYNVAVNDSVEDDAIIAVFTEAGVPGGATVAATATAANDTVVLDVTTSGAGYYYVTTSLGSLVIIDTTDPDPVINEKNGIPTISKWVYNTADEDYEHDEDTPNNTTVTYELDVDNITGAVNLVIHDSQPNKLDEDWTDFHPTVVLVDGTRTTLEENVDYRIILTGAVEDGATCSDSNFTHDCTFEINFIGYDFSNVSENAYIEVIYTATLKTEGDIYSEDMDEIDNWAVVSYGSNSTSAEVEAEVYSFGFEIFKYTDEQDDGIDVITVPVYNDSVNESQDYLYLALLGDRNDESSVTYFAVFSEVEGEENTYYISEWIDQSQVYYIQQNPWVILGYYDSEGNDMGELSYALEPAADVADSPDNAITYTFYYAGSVPSHDAVVLDEFGTGSMEEDFGNEEYTYYGTVQAALSGAQFKLTNASGQTAYFLEETVDLTDEAGAVIGTKHMYLFEGWLAEGAEVPAGYTITLTSDSTGYINIEGLDTGTYTVTETLAPDGYNQLTGPITVTITATYNEDTGAIETHTVNYSYGDTTGEGVVEVLNNTGSRLPSTGGIGTTIFYIIGGILVVGAVVVLVTRRRMTSES